MEGGSWTDLKESGEKHFQAGDFGEAARWFRKAVDEVPTSSETWAKLGFALQNDGNTPEAISAFKTSIGLDPQNTDAMFGIATAYMSNADFSRAISTFDQLLEVRPNHTRAKDELVRALLQDARAKLAMNDHYGGEASLERAYKIARVSSETVVPFVEHLIGSNQHKKAFDVINAAKRAAPDDARIRALAERMDNDPKLAHAKTITALRQEPKSGATPAPAKPVQSPDEVPCPCGAARVMRWATVCPMCNNRIGDPARGSAFAAAKDLPSRSWQETAYVIMSVLWLIIGIVWFVIGYMGLVYFEGVFMAFGVAVTFLSVGLLAQTEWVQFIAKMVMMLIAMLNLARLAVTLAFGEFGYAALHFGILAAAAFSAWLIGQMSD